MALLLGACAPTVSFDGDADTGCYWADESWHLVIGGQGVEDSYGICLSLGGREAPCP